MTATVPPADDRLTVVISINAAWNIVNFRLGLVRALVAAGYRVVAVTPEDRHAARFADLGIEHRSIAIDTRGTSPIRDVALLHAYWHVLGELRPAVYLGYTIKPNIWGSLAAQARGVPVINNIAGLGETFRARGLLNRLVRQLYRIALRRSHTIFFQNPEDRALFEDAGILSAGRGALLPGSGVDLSRFRPAGPRQERPFTFLLVARLLRAKGIGEFVAAASTVRARRPDTRFRVLGLAQTGGDAIDQATIATWAAAGDVEFPGSVDDVRPELLAADCVILPTFYPEGTPRSLLEAAATGLPIITTDVPGCRDVVVEGQNGYLVPPRDARALTAAMERLLALAPADRAAMGAASRDRAQRLFDERIVIDRYLQAIASATGQAAR